MKKLLFLLFLLPGIVNAQETSIAAGNYEGCGGFIVDSGLSASDYGPNENHTMTVCAEAPEEVVNLYFNLFSLGAGDQLSIYDGVDTSAPLIGDYTGFDLQGQDIFNSEANTTGCLTLVFTSDAAENGNFVAEVTCGYPCERPFAIVETEETSPLRICIGEEVSFDGSSSTVAEGFEITDWTWDFGDGNENSTDGAQTSHTYEYAGAYKVQLGLIDNNDCQNNNLSDIIVMVSTDPDFTGTSEDLEICLGQEVDLNGVVNGVTWDGTPETNLGGELFIPDDQENCFESSITFTSLLPGGVVESAEDIDNFFINFEHSFMGDLTIAFICPNGQSIAVHQQGGGGTFLGEPVDDDNQPMAQGVGYDYWWAPDATLGTWADESGGTLASDTYSSAMSWEVLEGCPLNGTWTIQICDSWGSDNGFIFDWTVNFDPSLFPDPIVFTPIFGMECDSTSWSGPSVIDESMDCNDITIMPTELGQETYTYTATNNHGCTYSTDVNVNVIQGPTAVTPDLLYYCNSPFTLDGDIENTQGGTTYSYSWSPSELVDNPNSSSTDVESLDEPTEFTLTVAPSNAPECASSSTVLVDIPDEPVIFEYDSLWFCVGDPLSLSAPDQPAGWTYSYSWDNILDPDPAFSNDPDIVVTETGLYELTITMNDPCLYSVSEEILAIFQPCEIFIPNIITPNGDDVNEYFAIQNLEFFPNSILKVYNRWGALVYESTDYKNDWSPSSSALSDGTYFYILHVNTPSGLDEYTGNLTVTR